MIKGRSGSIDTVCMDGAAFRIRRYPQTLWHCVLLLQYKGFARPGLQLTSMHESKWRKGSNAGGLRLPIKTCHRQTDRQTDRPTDLLYGLDASGGGSQRSYQSRTPQSCALQQPAWNSTHYQCSTMNPCLCCMCDQAICKSI